MTTARDKKDDAKDKPQDDGAPEQPVTLGGPAGPVPDDGQLRGVDTTHALLLADGGKEHVDKDGRALLTDPDSK